jgi:hypothetical protein
MFLKINKISFLLTIILIPVALISMFQQPYKTNIFWIHPLFIVFISSFILLGLGLFGFGGIKNRFGLIRSVTTIILSILLIIIIGLILLSGILFS